nr:tRNA pseudouridine(13) synthase TruD [Litorivivens lipolytica]
MPYAWGEPTVRGQLRVEPEHFQVTETLDLEFTGAGEFDWVYVEKRELTTPEAAELLQQFSGARDISYSGMKDKDGITRQWFSLQMLGQPSADWSTFDHPALKVLDSQRHQRKLRRGTHRYNHFQLVLAGVEHGHIAARIERIAEHGFPNYFGEQRFGREGNNLEQARRWLTSRRKVSRFKRGLWLSVLRAHLFNSVVAERVRQGNWNKPLDGDLFCLGDGNSVFQESDSALAKARVEAGEIHPSGPLPGKVGRTHVTEEALALEDSVLAAEEGVVAALVDRRVDAARRPLRVLPLGLTARATEPGCLIEFSLPRGCFATALVRELIDYQTVTPSV